MLDPSLAPSHKFLLVMKVALSGCSVKKLLSKWWFYRRGKKKVEPLVTVTRRWGADAICLQSNNEYRLPKLLICFACVHTGIWARHLAQICTALTFSYGSWKYVKNWWPHGKPIMALASWALIVLYQSDSCTEDGAYSALTSYFVNGDLHHSLLCPEKQHSEQLYSLKITKLGLPFNHLVLLSPQLGHWDLWAQNLGRKQMHRNKPTMCLLWASDLAYKCRIKNN